VAFLLAEAWRRRDPLLPIGLLAPVRRLTGLTGLATGAAGVFNLSFSMPLCFQQTSNRPALSTAEALVLRWTRGAVRGAISNRLTPQRRQ
jgi:hypothetical protein